MKATKKILACVMLGAFSLSTLGGGIGVAGATTLDVSDITAEAPKSESIVTTYALADGTYSSSITVNSAAKKTDTYNAQVTITVANHVITGYAISSNASKNIDKRAVSTAMTALQSSYLGMDYDTFNSTTVPTVNKAENISASLIAASSSLLRANVVEVSVSVPDPEPDAPVVDDNDSDAGNNDNDNTGGNSDNNIGDNTGDTPATNGYKDGTYTGTARCDEFDYDVNVSVVVSDGKVSKVDVSHNSSSSGDIRRMNNATAGMASAYVGKTAADSVAVDTVSGATYSSNAINQAVADALSKALNGTSDDDGDQDDISDNPGDNTSGNSDDNTGGNTGDTTPNGYKDGTYSGTARCDRFDYDVNVSVVVSDGKVSKVDVSHNSSSSGDIRRMNNATAGMASAYVGKTAADSVAVDTVSGATYSSNAINQAVADALSKALNSGSDNTGDNTGGNSNDNTGGNTGDNSSTNGYKDGTYSGTSHVSLDGGYALTANVTIAQGKITAVDITTTNKSSKNTKYITKAVDAMKSKFVGKSAAQSVSVDTVSSATKTSKAINTAVNAAVAKAYDNSSTPGDSTGGNTDDNTSTNGYKDGTYSGTSYVSLDGGYDLSANVTIAQGKITAVDITTTNKSSKNEKYITKAVNTMTSKFVGKNAAQSVSVDTVSGATKTSKAINTAVNAAVAKAYNGSSGSGGSDDTTSYTFKDGTYYASEKVSSSSRKGKSFTITVKVKMKHGRIDSYSIDENASRSEDEKLVEKVEDKYEDIYEDMDYNTYINAKVSDVSGAAAISQAARKATDAAVKQSIVRK